MKQLAIIKNISFGCRDCNKAVFSLSIYLDETKACLIILEPCAFIPILEKYNIYDINYLKLSPCWVNVENQNIEFLDLCIIEQDS